jgi:hypothetical protein
MVNVGASRGNIHYLVFIKDKKMNSKHHQKIAQRAQDIYDSQGINAKVIAIVVDRPYTDSELELLDKTDRITYIGDYDSVNETMDTYDKMGKADPGFTFTGLNYGNLKNFSIGFYNYEDFFNQTGHHANAIDNSDDDTKYISKYKKEHAGLFGTGNKVVDAFTWIARDAIHEGGGHGLGLSGHPDTHTLERYDKKKITSPQSIMTSANGLSRVRFPREQNPDVLKFLPQDLKIVLKFYNRTKQVSSGGQNPQCYCDEDTTTSEFMVYPHDNFQTRLKK